MADLPFVPARPDLFARLAAALDVEGKILRALVTLGALEGSDVVLLGDAPAMAAALRATGARLSVLDLPGVLRPVPDRTLARALQALPAASADAIVAPWWSFAGPSPASVAASDRMLREGGRLLVLQDYGRDDLDVVRGSEKTAELVAWSRRDGWYLGAGFRIHVVHAFWQVSDAMEAAELLGGAYGESGAVAASTLRRHRVAHNIAIYHRVRVTS